MGFFDYTLDKSIPVPLYYQLKQTILSEIQNGNVKMGDAIPTEDQYCNYFKISRTTVRQAIVELVSEGWLYRTKGKGTFVFAMPNRVTTNLSNMYTSFIEGVESVDKKPQMCVEEINIVSATEDVAKELKIAVGEAVIFIHRYQKVDDCIFSSINSYLRYPLCTHAMSKEKFSHESMYQILAECPDTRVENVVRHIYAQGANSVEAKQLNISKGEPLLLVVNQGISQKSGEPVIAEWVYYLGSKNKLVVEYKMGMKNF